MQKINISQQTIDDFWKSIKALFLDGKLQKKEKKKIIFTKRYTDIDGLIKKKLSRYDSNINLEKIIKADYEYLLKLVAYIDDNKKTTELTEEQKNYLFTLYERFKKADFIRQLNIKVCPYCNRNYIFNFTKNSKQEATAQLDHFFDKKTYPYLAVSIYNLIPSCSTCNQRKSAKKEDIFYPYRDSFNKKANFRIDGIMSLSGLHNQNIGFFDESRLQLTIEAKSDKDMVEKHIDVFNLKNIYNEHRDVIAEILKKATIYSDDYAEEIVGSFKNVFKDEDDFLSSVFCTALADEEINNRPLSKLTKDILEQLEII